MSRSLEKDKAEHMERVAQWVKEGSESGKNRKARNKGLIHLGLAVLQMVEKGEVKIEDVQKNVIQKQTKITLSLLQEAEEKKSS